MKIEIVECRFCYRYGALEQGTLTHFIILASRPPVIIPQKYLRLCQTSNLVKVLKFMILMDGKNRFCSSLDLKVLENFY